MDMYEILPYTKELDQRLDRFVDQESVNGTFLQSRRFLNYHPEGRFVEKSFILHKGGVIVAYFPGAEIDGEFVSHPGSTFGGPVIAKTCYNASQLKEILTQADQHLASQFKRARLKVTPAMFAEESPDLLDYMLEHLGYSRYTELSSRNPLCKDMDIVAQCNRNQRRLWKEFNKFAESVPQGSIQYRDLTSEEDIATFYKFLVISKEKHHTKPIHTLEDLMDLKQRLPENIRFKGLFYNGRYVCGMLQFVFPRTKVIHDQNISPDESFDLFHHTTPMNIMALQEAAQQGYTSFSWGISTEDRGTILNEDLFHYKESFGAVGTVNASYTKKF